MKLTLLFTLISYVGFIYIICLPSLLRTVDQQLLGVIIDLFHVLWFTILGQKEKQMTADEKHQSSVKCLPLPLINDFLCVALTISRHLG